MANPDHTQFITTELDPALLSTPFKVHAKWHVITGAPSSGKTTLINQMNKRGYQTSQEKARQYIEEEVAKGHSVDEQQADLASFVQAIQNFMLRAESLLAPEDTIFLDRGFPDSLPYCRVVGLNPNDYLTDCFYHRYASIFILDRLPVDHDGVRFEDETTADFLHIWTLNDYRALDYNPISVPVMSEQDRCDFIIEKLTEQNLISRKNDPYLTG